MNTYLDLISSLENLLGKANVLSEGDLSAYEVDWRKRYRGKSLAVVRPGNTAEVAAVVKVCQQAGISIVPQGGNTGLVGGGVPDESGQQILMSLQRMQKIRWIDRDNLSMTVDAGCILQNVQSAAAEHDLLFPLSLAAEGSCTIGGNLATNAGGTQVLRYGNARDLCLGLEVVTPQGEIWDGLTGLRKDNTGFDLRNLYIGSEGTLGIITGATLKLFPQPAAKVTAFARCRELGQAVEVLNLARQSLGDGLTGFEVMSDFSLNLVARHFPQLRQAFDCQSTDSGWQILFEFSSQSQSDGQSQLEKLMEIALDKEWLDDAVVASNIEQARHFWHLRESIPLAQAEEGLNIKHDISLPVSAITDFVQATVPVILQKYPDSRMVIFGHLGDGNLHFNVQAPVGQSPPEFLLKHEAGINQIVYDAVSAAQGSFSAEHGIGQLKREELTVRKSATAVDLMRRIKLALDPDGLMNPGKLI